MKKIILEHEESKIRLSEVTENDIIIIKNSSGKLFGTICYGSRMWHSIDGFGAHDYDSLSEAVSGYKDCEFYVLD